jgi:hypothetical protein
MGGDLLCSARGGDHYYFGRPYELTYLPEHTIRMYNSTFSTSSYVHEADMSGADRNDTTLSGPKMGDT